MKYRSPLDGLERAAVVLVIIALVIAFCVGRATAAGMIVSPGAPMGINTQGASGGGPPSGTKAIVTNTGASLVTDTGSIIIYTP